VDKIANKIDLILGHPVFGTFFEAIQKKEK
jgi:hypothetical protein